MFANALFLLVVPLMLLGRLILPLILQGVDPLDLLAVLRWLAVGGGSVILVNWIVSWLAENVPAWHKLSPGLKVVLTILFAVLISVGAQLLVLNYEAVAPFAPWFSIIMMAILGWIASQVAYGRAKRMGIGKWAAPIK